MSDQLQSERLAYEYMLQQFKAGGNKAMVRKLEAAPVTLAEGIPQAYLALRDGAMHSLGIGTTHDMHSVVTGVFLHSLVSREYTVMEKINTWRAKSRYGVSFLWDKMIATDLASVESLSGSWAILLLRCTPFIVCTCQRLSRQIDEYQD